jgi:hypothetical protein
MTREGDKRELRLRLNDGEGILDIDRCMDGRFVVAGVDVAVVDNDEDCLIVAVDARCLGWARTVSPVLLVSGSAAFEAPSRERGGETDSTERRS